jgi:hypothetical protein
LSDRVPSFDPPEVELTTWGVIYTLLGWCALTASIWGGAGEAATFLVAGLILVPLGFGLLFRWPLVRWAGIAICASVMVWSVWQIATGQTWLLPVALLLTSAETLWCLTRWRGRGCRIPGDR